MVEFDEESYTYLIQLLNEKYYRTEGVSELKLINHIYKQLKFKSESWLSAIPSKYILFLRQFCRSFHKLKINNHRKDFNNFNLFCLDI